MLIFLEATMLSVAAILGVSCSLSDLKQGIVPNKFLLIAAACGIVIHGLFLVFGGAPYYPTWLLNMALADIIAFILFYEMIGFTLSTICLAIFASFAISIAFLTFFSI